tara:strand:- start:127 stop:243 length:117 start_codon:yes stop_codon:yes gene_type:complete
MKDRIIVYCDKCGEAYQVKDLEKHFERLREVVKDETRN